ncbi:MAG TPA: protein kinase [Gemmatimonadales bacterium]|nr:protein kinase [Gemmatimonadales bacterium]
MTNSTVECIQCHTPVPANSRYCSTCGADQTGGGGAANTTNTAALEVRLQAIVQGKYKITRVLGKGGMGTVYLAHDLTLEREVAIKVLPPDVGQDEQVIRRFQQEAKTAAKLDHPNIIPIYRVESEGGLNYFVMKYVSGTSLEDVLEAREPLAAEYIQRVLWEAACALGHAHQRGVVHRDVKPANIMFDHDGRVMLTDFGISKALQAATGFTATGMIIGTPHYMAPEQAKGTPVDGRADQYSLGVVGYRMITGDLPFSGDSIHTILYKQIFEPVPTPRALRAEIPGFLAAAITRAMSKDPELRYPTMEAFATAVWPEQPVSAAASTTPPRALRGPITRAAADAPTQVSAPSAAYAATTPLPAAHPARPARPKRGSRAGVIGIAVVAVAAIGGYVVFGRGAEPEAAPAAVASHVDTVRLADTVRIPAPSGPTAPAAQHSRVRVAPVVTAPSDAQGYLTVNADPYGELYVDGVDVGPTPVVRYAVPRGGHTIRIVREGYRTITDHVQVEVGNTVPKRYTLIPEG